MRSRIGLSRSPSAGHGVGHEGIRSDDATGHVTRALIIFELTRSLQATNDGCGFVAALTGLKSVALAHRIAVSQTGRDIWISGVHRHHKNSSCRTRPPIEF